ncbi:hypothetical protein niasHS_001849 [Heterodera schachtii]|uniref:Uncharacterized protein n=1 Tax=Heterodera schachtii TaxID=97005 RepID=A0ABD2KB76_HETSC
MYAEQTASRPTTPTRAGDFSYSSGSLKPNTTIHSGWNNCDPCHHLHSSFSAVKIKRMSHKMLEFLVGTNLRHHDVRVSFKCGECGHTTFKTYEFNSRGEFNMFDRYGEHKRILDKKTFICHTK